MSISEEKFDLLEINESVEKLFIINKVCVMSLSCVLNCF